MSSISDNSAYCAKFGVFGGTAFTACIALTAHTAQIK